MSKFKAGDKVVYLANDQWYNFGEVYTVEQVFTTTPGPTIRAVGHTSNRYTSVWMHERDFVEMCIASLLERDISLEVFEGSDRYYKCSYSGDKGGSLYRVSVDHLLDKLYPLETPQQKKLKELEKQQRKIAEQMEELRKEL